MILCSQLLVFSVMSVRFIVLLHQPVKSLFLFVQPVRSLFLFVLSISLICSGIFLLLIAGLLLVLDVAYKASLNVSI